MARAQYICIGHGPRSRFHSEMKSTVQTLLEIALGYYGAMHNNLSDDDVACVRVGITLWQYDTYIYISNTTVQRVLSLLKCLR